MGALEENCVRIIRACEAAWRLPGFRILVKSSVEPGNCGLRETLGAPRKGKIADYEILGSDCSRCHIVLTRNGCIEAHMDSISPSCSPLGHILVDAWKSMAGLQGLMGVVAAAAGLTWLSLASIGGLALTLIARLLLSIALR